MIQRIQSLYLLLIALLSILFLNGGFLEFAEKSGSVIKVTIGGIIRETGPQIHEVLGTNLPLSILIIVIPLLSLVSIFMFKRRSLQIWLVRILIILIIALIAISGIYEYKILTKYDSEIIPGFKMIIPVVQLVLAILAHRGIKKDDELVKSYDRLR